MIDLSEIYRVTRSFCYTCVYKGVDAINRVLHIRFPLHDVARLKVLESEFAASKWGHAWRGQVGCIDGVHFSMRSPGKAVPNPTRYFVARKDHFCILCIAICDAQRRFLFYDMSKTATTHDSLAWTATPLGKAVMEGELPHPFFINGDAAFSRSDSMVVPSGAAQHDSYDYVQSSARMPIECAFGMLVRRWGLLWRPLEIRFDRRSAVIGACMRLHNFCIDHRILDQTVICRGLGETQPGRWELSPRFDEHGRPVEYLDTTRQCAEDQRSERAVRTHLHLGGAPMSTLSRLVGSVQAAGLLRPALAPGLHKKRKRK